MAKGIKTGGRKKGTKNKPRVNPTVVEEAIVASVASGLTPLEYMLDVMRDRTQEYARRDEMAKAAAPYVHARLAATVMEVKDNREDATKSADTLKAEVIALIADLGLAPMIPTGIANRTNGKDGTKH